jgi:phage terminase large subunit-like protein
VEKLVTVAKVGKLHRRGGRPTYHVSYKQTCWPSGAAAHAQKSGAGRLVKVVVGRKLHRRWRKTHLPREL